MAVLDTNTRLDGYQITHRLGDGGTASVFRGVQLSLKRSVAIKILKRNLLAQDEIRLRFELESLIIARLSHPNIIHVIDQGITSDGLPYFVMDYVKGNTLEKAIKNGNLSNERAIDYFIQIAKALAYAHKNNIAHCDIKPQNILIDREGTVRVLDFGIAQIYNKLIYSQLGKPKGSGERFVMGSPNYMSPEQRESASNATTQSDLYSLGVIMYYYFAGQFPNSGNNLPVLPLTNFTPSIDKALSNLILQCLEKQPAKRPTSADEVKHRLLQILQGKHLNQEQKQRANLGVNKEFKLLDVLRETQHCAVYLFQEQQNRELFVIKKKPLWQGGFDVSQKIKQLNYPNIVKILGSSKNERNFIIVSEYCVGGSLAERITRPFKLVEFYPIAISLTETMASAHEQNIVHGNLRPSNILFDGKGSIKICDFGLDEHYDTKFTDNNWYSPEHEKTSKFFDAYSAGVIFHQMLTGELPERKYTKFVPSEKFKKLPEKLQLMISNLLHLDPEKRIANFHQLAHILKDLQEAEATIIRPNQFKSRQKTAMRHYSANHRILENEPRASKLAAACILAIFLFLLAVDTQVVLPEVTTAMNMPANHFHERP